MLTAAIARHLNELGHGTFDPDSETEDSIHLEELPVKPVDAVSVAFKPGPTDNTVDGYAREAIAVVVRRPNTTGRARSGYDLARAIRDDLNGLTHTTLAAGTVDETRVVWLMSDDGGPTNIGDDSNGTPRWSLRFYALTAHDTAHTKV